MKYVYMLQSIVDPLRHYVGITVDLKRRFKEHNQGLSLHTKKHAPWKLVGYVAFADHDKADKLEKYLKTASGRAFAKKHF